MSATLNHIQINVTNAKISGPFYKEMLTLLGYKVFIEEGWGFGMQDPKNGLVIWICPIEDKYIDKKFHRKAPGLNHLAFQVESKHDVDKFNTEFVLKNKITTLYETPKAFPEYSGDYYAVFFEDPDRVKLEVVFM